MAFTGCTFRRVGAAVAKASDLCYPNAKDDSRLLKADPQYVICHCGRRIEQDEKGVWFHVS